MEKHTIYIITDSNRTYLEVGYCTDFNARIQEIRDSESILFGSTAKLNNVVYLEEFKSIEEAMVCLQQLKHFTRMQRERLIRTKNPNWLNLRPLQPCIETKKVVVYA